MIDSETLETLSKMIREIQEDNGHIAEMIARMRQDCPLGSHIREIRAGNAPPKLKETDTMQLIEPLQKG